MKNLINRRGFVQKAGLAAGTLATVSLVSQAASAEGGGHHHHHPAKNTELVKMAAHCIHTGNACIAHCLDMISQGNTDMAECARSVQYLVSMCETVGVHAASDSKHLKDLLVTCLAICEDCEAECRKFEQHEQCLECAESCVAMTRASQAYLDAA